MTPAQRPHGPSPGTIRRRRIIALVAIAGAIALAVASVVVALPHVHKTPVAVTVAPPPKPFRIIFPEGFTRRQMAQRVAVVAQIAKRKRGKPVSLNSRQYLIGSRKATVPCFTPKRPKQLEGLLFPATYDFLPGTTARQLVAEQLQAFCVNWAKVDLAYARSKQLTPYDVLIIASMVEKETLAPEERRLVAAVIYNRLHQRMPLGIDATLRYGLNIPPTKSILQSQLDSNNPYNSRKLPGLPPTPIASPGLASIQAAAHPAKVDYLFFVRKPDKKHHFFTASDTAFAQYECAHGYGC
ncbi:MAG: endolytic transglycosylase MltG [Actinobacteria bacterium]|nr:endolytic transglycosylase MltG [Actinomycetota bacterium]